MKKIITLLVVFLSLPTSIKAQWAARQSIGAGQSRARATAFSVNGKAYVVGGSANFIGKADVWEYDPVTNTWAQKNNFPGGPRGGAVAFSISNKGYLMGGNDYISPGHYYNDVWEYNDITDTWTQKNNFPGQGREEAIGFVIGNKGYLGTGYEEVVGPNSTFFSAFDDFWEYDPAADSWTAKAVVPGGERGWAIGAAAGGKGYAGLGGNDLQNSSYNDFYEYDPATDTWTAKANYAVSVGDAMAFNVGNDIYICGGIDFSNYAAYSVMKKYDAATNTWSNAPAMPAGATMGGVAVNIGNRAFVGTGYNAAIHEKNDWWEFVTSTSTLCPAPIVFSTATVAASNTVQCNGQISISNITNGCGPYTYSIMPNNGTLVPGTSGFTATGLCAAAYSVYITDANCCGTIFSVRTVPADPASGISGYNAAEIHVSPNPSNGTFKISFNNSGLRESDVRFFNYMGQDVPAQFSQNSNEYDVQLSEPGAGIYFIEITSGDQVIRKKIVVN